MFSAQHHTWEKYHNNCTHRQNIMKMSNSIICVMKSYSKPPPWLKFQHKQQDKIPWQIQWQSLQRFLINSSRANWQILISYLDFVLVCFVFLPYCQLAKRLTSKKKSKVASIEAPLTKKNKNSILLLLTLQCPIHSSSSYCHPACTASTLHRTKGT